MVELRSAVRIPAERLLDPKVIVALNSWDWRVLKLLTKGVPSAQSLISEATGLSQPSISRLMSGHTKTPNIHTVRLLCDALGIPRDLAGLAPLYPRVSEEAETTNRRDFLSVGLAAGLGLKMPDLAHRPSPGEIEREVKLLRQAGPRLLVQNDELGGTKGLREIATELFHRADRLVHHAMPGATTTSDLQSLAGQFAMYAGWLYYDGGDQDRARLFWQQAMYQSQLAQDPVLEVYALESLSAQATYFLERPNEGVSLAKKAQTVASRWASPRVTSLLQMREAGAWAWAGDRVQFERVFKLAASSFTDEISADDPDWMSFYGEAELEGLRAIGYMSLGNGVRAESHIRPMLSSLDATFRRNRLYYTAMLGRILGERGDVTGASELLEPKMHEFAKTGSWRTHRHVRVVLDKASHAGTPRARALVEVAKGYGLSSNTTEERK